MTVRRVMGIETEYGVSTPGDPTANPMITSTQVVNGYSAGLTDGPRARWDFEEEGMMAEEIQLFELITQVRRDLEAARTEGEGRGIRFDE